MATEAAKAPVLNGPEDWYDWLNYIKDLATTKRVWDHVNPNIPDVDDLDEPIIFTPKDVRTGVINANTLDECQRSQLTLLQRLYA